MHQLIQAIQQDFNSRLTEKNSICVVFRHFIEHSMYPQAQKAGEAAAAQGQFWQMHDMLFTFVPGGIDEFFPQISQTPPEGWTDLGNQYDSLIVGAPLSVK